MGHISEPKGIDFLIQSQPLTEKERKELSEFIQSRKVQKLGKDVLIKTKLPTKKKSNTVKE